MSKTVGYARVSTKEQNLDRQIKALLQYVAADMIVVDKASGKDLERPGYQSLKYGIGKLQKGDVLYILDCCNGEILSLEMRNNMKKELCIKTAFSTAYKKNLSYISETVTLGISEVVCDFEKHKDMTVILQD